MRYEVDQSIKIEDTARTSYVALTNSKNIVVSISSQEKKKVEMYFRALEKPLIFKIFTFSMLCTKAIGSMDLRKEDVVLIDREYAGQERRIKSYIKTALEYRKLPVPELAFGKVGKQSHAHLRVYKAYKTSEKCLGINANQIIKIDRVFRG